MDEHGVVELPRFELTMEESLENILGDMGMRIAFDPNRADFTGINPAGDLFISSVLHKTFIRVDEEGTEAAAATSVGVGTTSVPIPIRFDRPFVFALVEGKSGAMFFLGKVEHI
jgi:serpin B